MPFFSLNYGFFYVCEKHPAKLQSFELPSLAASVLGHFM